MTSVFLEGPQTIFIPRDEVLEWHVVYAMFSKKTNEVKIGTARCINLRSRFTTLQTQTKLRLRIMSLQIGSFKEENDLHRRFKKHRTRGREWFRANSELEEYIRHARAEWNKIIESRPVGGYLTWSEGRGFRRELFEEPLGHPEPMTRCFDSTPPSVDGTCIPGVCLAGATTRIEKARTMRFPVLIQGSKAALAQYTSLQCPVDVPWELIGTRRARCLLNHGQTPETLARRGGLAPSEMIAVIEDRPWQRMSISDSIAALKKHLP